MLDISIGDIDIDLADRTQVLSLIDHIPAKLENGKKHNTSVYVQDIEYDPLTMMAEINYKECEYIKIDFLNFNILKMFNSNNELEEFMNKEPDWDLLKDKNFVECLPHIHGHYKEISDISPKSVEELVEVLMKIREHTEYKFKKSHAYAYALTIIAVMNKLCSCSD